MEGTDFVLHIAEIMLTVYHQIVNKSMFFLVPISVCIIVAYAGAIGLGITQSKTFTDLCLLC